MNKPIIIDGVDVNECEDLTNQLCCEQYWDGECEGHYCYYKQLQRLKTTLKHVEKGKKIKAEKLKKIEEIVTHCIQGGFTDDFIQQIFDLCRENEDI